MKYISFTIPCYNSQDYMEKAINSLLSFKDDIEIIIVNDGSLDNTSKIAHEYEKKYNCIKVIDKENGGHGSGVNVGLKEANGLYFKVLDSDDWIDEDSLKKVINKIKQFEKNKILVDLIIVNYVYEKMKEKKEINYKYVLPVNEIFSWNSVKRFMPSENLLMHSCIYNTKVLKSTKIKLPEHTFYVDNIFVYCPLPYINTMYYMDVPFYRYYIGRVDQSVNEQIMIKRIDQQLFVTKTMIDAFNPYDFQEDRPKLTRYLIHYIDMMMVVSTILLQVSGTKENQQKRIELWNYLKEKNYKLYTKCKQSLSGACNLPRWIAVPGYKAARKLYKFN